MLPGELLQDDLLVGVFDALGDQSDHVFDGGVHGEVQFEETFVAEAISVAHVELLPVFQVPARREVNEKVSPSQSLPEVVLDCRQWIILVRLIDIDDLNDERDARQARVEHLV